MSLFKQVLRKRFGEPKVNGEAGNRLLSNFCSSRAKANFIDKEVQRLDTVRFSKFI